MKTTVLKKIMMVGVLVFLVCKPVLVSGQPAPIPYHMEAYILNSGVYDGSGVPQEQPLLVTRKVVRVPDAPWLRLFLGKCNLGNGSYLKITSLEDGAQQHLNSISLEQWQNTSAFFNGQAVEVELCVASEDKNVYFEIQKLMIGEHVNDLNELNLASQDPCSGWCGICGGIDDRIAENDPAIGRIMPNSGCTGWIASNGAYLTAGHCVDSFADNEVLQFNVPASNDSGVVSHPPPEDQYYIIQDSGSIEYVNNGVGQDWAVFNCYPNSETSLLPVQAQDAFYRLSLDSNPSTFLITGFGLDECPPGTGVLTQRNSDSQTQQTSTGANNGESGSGNRVSWRFSVDLRNGNSGGPIIPENTGLSVGIVTHCPCPNAGTSFKTDDLENAVNTFFGTNITYADNGHPFASGQGTVFRPYATVGGAVSAVSTGGIVSLVSGAYNENMTINKALTLTAPVGSVTIGPTPSPKFAANDQQSDKNSFLSDESMQSGYNVRQNYPNPFNPETTIEYTLPKNAFVTLKVYNMLGQEVRTLVNEFQKSGLRDVVWDGKNNLGEPVSSGAYVYRIQVGDFAQSFKVILLK